MLELKTFKRLLFLIRLIPQKYKVDLFFLSLSIIATSIIEVISVYLVVPFYKILVDNKSIEEIFPFIVRILNLSFNSFKQEQFITITSFAIFFIFANILRTFTRWNTDITSARVGAYLFSKAYSNILSRSYESLLKENISRFSSNFLTTNIYIVSIIKNLLILSGYLTTTIVLFFALLFLNPLATIFAIIFIIIPYLIITRITKPSLKKLSNKISFMHEDINRYLQECFKSLKTIKIYHANNYYTEIFKKNEYKLREKIARGEFLQDYPKYLLEALGLTSITILFGFSYLVDEINIPLYFIIAFALASQKLLPALQQIYRIWSLIINYSCSIDDLHDYFIYKEYERRKITFKKNEIVFKNVFFKYPSDKKYILNKINLNISYPNSISITGDSGCGKTTFVDLLTGLLSCSDGSISLPKELKDSQNIAYVPQEVPILNGSILENIFLGMNDENKDYKVLEKYLKLVKLYDFFQDLPLGLNTLLGEQAINLSGGQKQRLGILRALIREPKILILDESTNAIDSECEEFVIENLLKEFEKKLIIIISHNQKITNKFKLNLNFNKKGIFLKAQEH